MSIIEAIIQGIVQGISEFLPISSSGHLAITQHIMGQSESGGSNLFFNVMLHLGTLFAVCIFYRKTLIGLIKALFKLIADIFRGHFKWSQMSADRNLIIMLMIGLLPLFLLFMPIGGGENIKDMAEFMANSEKAFIFVGFSLLLTSILLTLGLHFNKRTTQRYKAAGKLGKSGAGRRRFRIFDAISVGLMQLAAAILPGLSRSGSTLAVGEMRGINKQTALDYTFVLSIPSILAAVVMEGKDALGELKTAAPDAITVIFGMLAAAFVGYLSISMFKWLLKTNKIFLFAIYTAIIGIIVVIISLMEMQSGLNIFTGRPLV